MKDYLTFIMYNKYMKSKLSKQETQEKIKLFFEKENFTKEEVKKIRRLAMKFNIKLGKLRQKFCKSCLSQLKGKTRLSKTHKTIECQVCMYKNKFRI